MKVKSIPAHASNPFSPLPTGTEPSSNKELAKAAKLENNREIGKARDEKYLAAEQELEDDARDEYYGVGHAFWRDDA